jgi:hypothetical protein
MRNMRLSASLAFMLGFVLITPAHAASSDTDFKAWLAGLNGSRWIIYEDTDYIRWLELNGDMITTWFYYKTNKRGAAGTTERLWSRKVEKRLFIRKDRNEAFMKAVRMGVLLMQRWSVAVVLV